MLSEKQYQNIVDETKKLVELFIRLNASDIELSRLTGISSSTVGRRLTNHDMICAAFEESGERIYNYIKEKRQENLAQAKLVGGRTSAFMALSEDNNEKREYDGVKLSLNILGDNLTQQYTNLLHMILCFKISLKYVSQAFIIPEKELYYNLARVTNNNSFKALGSIINSKDPASNISKEKFLNFYRELIQAKIINDYGRITQLMSIINDSDVINIKNRDKEIPMTDNDIMSIFGYQVKYSLSNEEVAMDLGMTGSYYTDRLMAILNTNEELKTIYDDLMASISKKSHLKKSE